MDKETIVSNVAGKAGYTKASVREIIEAYNEVLLNELVDTGALRVHGLGTFRVITRKARTAVCRLGPGGKVLAKPKKIAVPEKKAVTFKAAAALREKVQ